MAAVVSEIKEVLGQRGETDFEIILVNDCSPDNVWSVIQRLSEEDPRVRGVCLCRNFGQHAALQAGYAFARGEYVVSLDDDGQAPIDQLYKLVDKLEEGYDAVYGGYNEIKQNAFRRFGSWMAAVMAQVMMGKPRELKVTSFYIARSFVIKEMIKYDKPYPYLFGLLFRITKKVTWVPTDHRERLQGKSGYSFRKLFALWLNGFTAFSVKPLEIGTYAGLMFAAAGFVGAVVTVVRKLLNPDIAAGWSSLISVMLLLGGIILVVLGLIGEYVGRIYICINNSPQYVIRETVNMDGGADSGR